MVAPTIFALANLIPKGDFPRLNDFAYQDICGSNRAEL